MVGVHGGDVGGVSMNVGTWVGVMLLQRDTRGQRNSQTLTSEGEDARSRELDPFAVILRGVE